MELHIVSANTKYPSVSTALEHPDGLAVLGFWFQISGTNNTALDPIISNLRHVRDPGTQVDLDPLTLESILPRDLHVFYRYTGSLTTPGCQEVVTWTVFRSVIQISERQMQEFRSLRYKQKTSDGDTLVMVDNYRPVQCLWGRKVTEYSSA